MDPHHIQMLILVLLNSPKSATKLLSKDFSQEEIDDLFTQANELDWRNHAIK